MYTAGPVTLSTIMAGFTYDNIGNCIFRNYTEVDSNVLTASYYQIEFIEDAEFKILREVPT